MSQSNILVDLDGTARIAGFGSAFVPSKHHPTWLDMDTEPLYYGTAPELIDLDPPGSRIKTTKESDIYTFALLAWEVCCFPPMLFRKFANLYQLDFRRTGSFL